MDSRVTFLWVHLGFSFSLSSDLYHHEYRYVNIRKNWTNAQRYCRENYKDLATFESMDDILKLNRPSLDTKLVWIGLWDDPRAWKDGMKNNSNSWKWISTGTSLRGFHQWTNGKPQFHKAEENCVLVNRNGNWGDSKCTHKTQFVCSSDSTLPGNKNYTFFDQSLNWDDAQSVCRQNNADLAIIENKQESTEVGSFVTSSYVWIGLRREPWLWSDGSNSSFRNWVRIDNKDHNEHCITEKENHEWVDTNCEEGKTFVCNEEVLKVKKNSVRMRMQSDADLSDPSVNQQILQQVKVTPTIPTRSS